MSALPVSGIIFILTSGGILLGALLRRTLPKHHLDEHARDVVRLGVGLIALHDVIRLWVVLVLVAMVGSGLEGEVVIPSNVVRGSLQATVDRVVAIANGASVPDKSSEPR